MTKWEYMVRGPENLGGHNALATAVEKLNRLGQDGWELVVWVPFPSSDPELRIGFYLLKRPADSN